eukprot:901779-Rhodomonas_salina.1
MPLGTRAPESPEITKLPTVCEETATLSWMVTKSVLVASDTDELCSIDAAVILGGMTGAS